MCSIKSGVGHKNDLQLKPFLEAKITVYVVFIEWCEQEIAFVLENGAVEVPYKRSFIQ